MGHINSTQLHVGLTAYVLPRQVKGEATRYATAIDLRFDIREKSASPVTVI
jgi:hypothetical protein